MCLDKIKYLSKDSKILIHYPQVLNVFSFYLDACLLIDMILSIYMRLSILLPITM